MTITYCCEKFVEALIRRELVRDLSDPPDPKPIIFLGTERRVIPTQAITFCPFCGSQEFEIIK
jgi:hypothetical protein